MEHEAKAKLQEILAKTNHALTLDDFEDIQELDRLAAAVVDPVKGIDSPLKHHAVFFHGEPCHPITLAHLTFIDEAFDLLGLSDDERALLMLFAASVEEITDDLYDQRTLRKRFKNWARKSRWDSTDMEAVLDLRYGKLIKKAKSGEKGDTNDSALIGLMVREYGETPRYWMYKAPLGLIESCIADWNHRQEAQAEQMRRASGGKGKAVAPPPSPKYAAAKEFREYAERIEEKWLAKNHS